MLPCDDSYLAHKSGGFCRRSAWNEASAAWRSYSVISLASMLLAGACAGQPEATVVSIQASDFAFLAPQSFEAGREVGAQQHRPAVAPPDYDEARARQDDGLTWVRLWRPWKRRAFRRGWPSWAGVGKSYRAGSPAPPRTHPWQL